MLHICIGIFVFEINYTTKWNVHCFYNIGWGGEAGAHQILVLRNLYEYLNPKILIKPRYRIRTW
jgi:hypothetical protein